MQRRQSDDDTHYRMCKKIAQLTKVVYQLNTQNEDYDARTAELRGSHETEVREVYNSAEQRVEEMQRAFRAAEEQRVSAVEAAQQLCKKELAEAKNVYAQKVASMVEELSSSKKRFEDALTELRSSCRSAAENAAEKKCAAKDEEMANLVREYNERYKSMLAEQMDARDSLEEKLRTLQSQLDATATRATESKQLADKLRDAGEAAAARAALELAQWKESNDRHEAEARRLQQEYDALKRRLDAETNSLTVSRGAGAALQHEAEELRRQLVEAHQACQRAESMIEAKAASLAKAQSDITDLENQRSLLETRNGNLSHDLDLAYEEKRQLTHQVVTLKSRVAELQKELDETAHLTKGEAERSRQVEMSLEERCAELQRRLDECIKRHNEELATLRSEHEHALSNVHASLHKSSETLIDRIRREKEELVGLHAAELQRLQERHQEEVTRLKQDQLMALEELRAQLSAAHSLAKDLRAVQEKMRERAATLEEELDAARTTLQDTEAQRLEMVRKYEALRSESARQLQELEMGAEARLHAEREANTSKESALEAELLRLRKQFMSDLGVKEREWMEKNGMQAKTYEQQMRELRTNQEESLRRLAELHDTKIKQMHEAHQMEIRQIREMTSGTLDKERIAYQRTQKEILDRLQHREGDLKQVKDQLDRVRQDAKEQARRLSEELLSRNELISRLNASHEKLHEEIRLLSTSLHHSREKCGELEEKLQAAKERELELQLAYEQLGETSNSARLELETMHKAYIAQMDVKHAQEMSKALDELRTTLTAAQNSMQQRADEALSALRQKYTNSKKEGESLKLSLDALTQDLRSCTMELAQERQNMTSAQHEHAARIDAMRCSFEGQLQQQQRLMEDRLNEAGAKHKVFVDDLMKQYAEERTMQDAVVRELQAALDDLRHRYEYRESRGEDVAMINRLIKEGRQKDHALKKALNDMNMYKLELINREESYNKVFGRRPLVASSESADKIPLQRQQQSLPLPLPQKQQQQELKEKKQQRMHYLN